LTVLTLPTNQNLYQQLQKNYLALHNKSNYSRILIEKAKTRDFYGLLNYKIHTVSHTGPIKWNNTMRLDEYAEKKFSPP
jgi:hypothetical protein